MKKFYLVMLLIVSIIVSSVFFSCVKETNGESKETDSNDSSASDTVNEGEAKTDVPQDIPAIDMSGKTFRILTAGWYDYPPLSVTDIVKEEMTGESLDDAVRDRQLYLEEKYNIKIEQIDFVHFWESDDSLLKTIQADEAAYDLALMRSCSFNSLATGGNIYDLSEIPTIDLERPWWDSNSYDSLSLLGKHYGICSDITMNDDLSVWCVFFNKNMIQDYALDNPYNLVKNNQWTYDKIFEMGKLISKDVNSDGIRNKDDMFGINHINDAVLGMMNCVGVNIGELDNSGNLEFTLNRENNITKMLNILTNLFDQDNVYNLHARGEGVADGAMFSQGQILFDFSAIQVAPGLRMMEQDFGILPYPKYDETQSDYMSSVSPLYLTVSVVPVTNTDLENTGIIMEEMAYQGYKNIRPAFYDILLEGKIARDDESLDMLDYIFKNVVYDVGAMWNIGAFSWEFVSISQEYNLNVASFIEARKEQVQSDINKITEELTKANG